jgi:hypothetical protein
MVTDLIARAKGLIDTLEELIELAKFLCDDYQEGLRVEGFLEGVDRSLRKLLERERLCLLSCQLREAARGSWDAKAGLEERDPESLRQALLTLATGEDDPNAIAYLKERFKIDLSEGGVGTYRYRGIE